MKANAFFSSFTSTQPKTASKKRIRPSYELTFVKNLPFRKKDGRVHYTPEFSLLPKNAEELVVALRFAAQRRKRVAFASQGYSPSRMTPVADILVYMQDLKRVAIDAGRSDKPVLVLETGATLKDVENLLSSTNYSLPLHFNVGKTKMGPKSATSLFEFIRSNPKAIQLVEWVERIDANGQVRRLNIGSNLREVTQMAGKAGVIYRMGVSVVG
jgi:hypothetical protein